MKRKHLYSFLFMIAFVHAGCAQSVGGTPPSMQTLVPTPILERIPIEIGETPPDNEKTILGTWQARDFTISSRGNISGKLELAFNRSIDSLDARDFLMIQVWANYIWPLYGDYATMPVGEFIPVEASRTTSTSATFEINEDFAIPALMLESDGGMPLYYLQITMVWFRWSQTNSMRAGISNPEPLNDQPFHGAPIFDRSLSLEGKLGWNFRDDIDIKYWEWLQEKFPFPTNTPAVYPEPISSPTPVPLKPYPMTPYP
jgi:hypothetical protein